jgi:hypothetical protein
MLVVSPFLFDSPNSLYSAECAILFSLPSLFMEEHSVHRKDEEEETVWITSLHCPSCGSEHSICVHLPSPPSLLLFFFSFTRPPLFLFSRLTVKLDCGVAIAVHPAHSREIPRGVRLFLFSFSRCIVSWAFPPLLNYPQKKILCFLLFSSCCCRLSSFFLLLLFYASS